MNSPSYNKPILQNEEPIYILLPVHNRVAITLKFIDCLLQQTYENFQLILIDDGSIDGTSEAVKKKLKNVDIISGDGNLWWAGCLNKGFDWLEANNISEDSIVLIINDDVIFDANFIHIGINLLKQNEKTLLLSRFRNKESGKTIETGMFADFSKLHFTTATSPEKINCLSTRGLFLYWRDIKKIGHFNSRLLPHYGSDYEYTIRAYRKGYKLVTSDQLSLIYDVDRVNPINKDAGSFQLNIIKMFDRRYVMNPLVWTKLVLLTSPWQWLLPNLIRVWYRTFKSLAFST